MRDDVVVEGLRRIGRLELAAYRKRAGRRDFM